MYVLPCEEFEPLGEYFIVLPVCTDGKRTELKIGPYDTERLLRADQLLKMMDESLAGRSDMGSRDQLAIDKKVVDIMLEAMESEGA